MRKISKVLFVTLAVMMVLAIPVSASAAGWQKDSAGRWSYNTGSGWVQNGWKQVGGQWYFFENAYMKTGWKQIGGAWYYMKPSGVMATSWQKVGSVWYYFKSSGAMATSWLKLGNTWYYLKQSGAMAVGWIEVGGKWYYMNSSGAMLANQWVGSYWLGADGAWVPNKNINTGNDDNNSGGQSAVVWLSATGSKFHRINNCGNMNPNRATKISRADAIDRGYTACDVCNP